MNKTKEIETVAAELGYTESMECSALDYIIETAKASVMVNQKNVELVAQVEALKDWRKLALQFDGHRMQAMCMLKAVAAGSAAIYEVNEFIAKAPVSGTEHLNQIKAEAVLKFSARLLVNQKIDVIEFAKQLADELNQGGEL